MAFHLFWVLFSTCVGDCFEILATWCRAAELGIPGTCWRCWQKWGCWPAQVLAGWVFEKHRDIHFCKHSGKHVLPVHGIPRLGPRARSPGSQCLFICVCSVCLQIRSSVLMRCLLCWLMQLRAAHHTLVTHPKSAPLQPLLSSLQRWPAGEGCFMVRLLPSRSQHTQRTSRDI